MSHSQESRSNSEKISEKKAIQLLKKEGCNRRVIEHCKAVSREALKMARKLKRKGFRIDVDFVKTASMLHDIGRSKTHGIRHGIEGARILKKHPKYARVCRTHIGAGIDRKEAKRLKLPAGDYTPKTLEEKIIAHADNTIDGSKVVKIEETIRAYEKKLGKNHSATLKIRELSDYINKRVKG